MISWLFPSAIGVIFLKYTICLSFNSCLKGGINNNVHQFPFMLLVTGRLFALKQGVHLQKAKEDVIFLNGLMKCLQTFKKQKGLFRKVY